MQASNFGSVELQMLWLSVALGLVQIFLVIVASGVAGRTPWAIGSRDVAGPPFGKIGARLERALKNYVESFAFFAAVVLLANTLGKHSNLSAVGAELFLAARVAYVPIYAAGIPVLRTLVWTAGFVGILLVLLTVWPGI